MTRMTGGQALVRQLIREGVDTVFGLPGVQLDWAFDALYEEREHIRVVHARHEQGTAYMADGYARSTGRVGVCMVVPGPGLLNTGAALSTAYACSSPVLCISGQVDSKLIGVGRGVLHEVKDQITAIASVTKWQGRAMTPGEIPGLVRRAFVELTSGRPRPVEIEIPPDVLQAEGDVELIEPTPPERGSADAEAIDRAARLLGPATNPLIMAGGGVIGGEAWAELERLATLLEAPVIMTQNARGAISDRHYLSLNDRATALLAPEADVILAVGTRFVASITPGWAQDGQRVIQIDVDAEEVGRNRQPDVGIVADARVGLAQLAARVEMYNRRRDSRREEQLTLKDDLRREGESIQPQAGLAAALRAALPDDAIIVSEMTQVGYWSNRYFPVYEPRSYLTPGYQGTLGFGFATAIGAQVGLPSRRVVSINGDGGFFYNVQELSTVVQQDLPLITVVFNDNAFGNVKRIQEMRFGGRRIASDLHNPDLLKLADAYGMQGRRATDAASLERELRTALESDIPVLIEVPVAPMPLPAPAPENVARRR